MKLKRLIESLPNETTSLSTNVQILPYISQKNDRLGNSLLSSLLALNGYVSSRLKGSKLVPKFRIRAKLG